MISFLFYFRRWNPRLQKACRMLYPCTREPASSTLTTKDLQFRACNTTLDLLDKPLLLSEIEDITWLRRDTKFVFECWKIFHEWAQGTSEIFFSTLEDKFRISKRCSIYYLNTNKIPNHFTEIVFWSERCGLLWSHSNGDIFTCEDNIMDFHMWRYQVFARKLTWYFSGVCIIILHNTYIV